MILGLYIKVGLFSIYFLHKVWLYYNNLSYYTSCTRIFEKMARKITHKVSFINKAKFFKYFFVFFSSVSSYSDHSCAHASKREIERQKKYLLEEIWLYFHCKCQSWQENLLLGGAKNWANKKFNFIGIFVLWAIPVHLESYNFLGHH